MTAHATAQTKILVGARTPLGPILSVSTAQLDKTPINLTERLLHILFSALFLDTNSGGKLSLNLNLKPTP